MSSKNKKILGCIHIPIEVNKKYCCREKPAKIVAYKIILTEEEEKKHIFDALGGCVCIPK